jgi:DNA-binding LytR/AlgR family response regulator
MEGKLRCVIVDDEWESHQTIIELLKDSMVAEVVQSFYKPSELLKDINNLAIDVVFLDIMFPNDSMQGFDAAQLLNAKNIMVIFISGNGPYIIEACNYVGAIDVIPKPNSRERLNSAVMKAWNMISAHYNTTRKTHEFFSVVERKEQVCLVLDDILFVKTSVEDPRNKKVILRNSEKLTLRDYNFEYLLNLSVKLARINISELISYDIVEAVLHDSIYLRPGFPPGIPRITTLSKTYRHFFKDHIV